MKVGVVTVSRSDYGHLRPVLDAIAAGGDLRLQLFVGGMHLAPAFGLTVREIEADGREIAERVEMLVGDDAPTGIAASIGRGVEGFARAYARCAPDVVLVLGDRFEMLAAATAALPFALPVAHLHGGEVTEGAIDNQIRHAITKLAHVHLVAADAHAKHVASLGEEAWRIHTVGAPGLDRIPSTPRHSRAELAARLGLPLAPPWIAVTYHPVTLEHTAAPWQVDELLAALDKVDGTLIVTYPNADTAHRAIVDRLEDFARGRARARLVRSLGDDVYLSLLAHADAMVGNSSSGLIEAPSFALPVVNVGTRQDGRLRAPNVIDVGHGRDEILAALEKALAPAFRDGLRGLANPYGDGHAAPRIVEVLRALPLGDRLVRKRAA